MLSMYVLPSEPGKPPRAVVGVAAGEDVVGLLATWSPDQGAWTVPSPAGPIPLPSDLDEALTEHAKSLGVEW